MLKAYNNNFQHFDMHTNCSFGRQKYRSNTGKHGIERTGQEKLFYADLMACIAYVCEYDELPASVVVAGGAEGMHFTRLVKMFPTTIQWHLYDPEPFARDLQFIENVYLYNQLYTEKDSRTWAKQAKTLFLSDIRNVNYTPTIKIMDKLSLELSRIRRHNKHKCHKCMQEVELKKKICKLRDELEDMALEDMKNQAQMVKDTEAEMSFIKFRLPYASNSVEQFYPYLKGRVFFQPKNRCNSTECRLMITPENAHMYKQLKASAVFANVCYDVLKHEEQCAFINNQLRPEWDSQAIRILEDTYACIKHEFRL